MNVTDRIADLSMLWKQASAVFPYFDRVGIDWDRAYRDYLPRVMGAETGREFHLLLAEFMNLLGDGHTDYQPPKALIQGTGFLPFTLRYVRNFYCIDGAVPAYRAHCGAQIRSVNGAPFADLIWEASRYSYHVGGYVSRYRLHQILPFFLKPTGNRVETDGDSFSFDLLPAKPEDLEAVKLTLPDPCRQVGRGKLDIRLYDGGLLYVKLNDFLYAGGAEEVRAAICETPGVSGLLLDLRENIGGMTMFGAKIAELLIPGQFRACQKRTRSMTGVDLSSASQIMRWSPEAIEKHIAAGNTTPAEVEESRRYAANIHCDEYISTYGEEGRAALFDGPCVLLTSRHTVSAAEDFVAMFRANRRAVIVGTATCGTTGTPLIQELSCGGAARVCSVGYRLLDGTEFIGRGITPDVQCDIDLGEFRRGYDGVLRKGMEVLRSLIQTGGGSL